MTKPKLRFYRPFKNTFKMENYLKMNLTCFEWSHLAQPRLGILPLMIELGRTDLEMLIWKIDFVLSVT